VVQIKRGGGNLDTRAIFFKDCLTTIDRTLALQKSTTVSRSRLFITYDYDEDGEGGEKETHLFAYQSMKQLSYFCLSSVHSFAKLEAMTIQIDRYSAILSLRVKKNKIKFKTWEWKK